MILSLMDLVFMPSVVMLGVAFFIGMLSVVLVSVVAPQPVGVGVLTCYLKISHPKLYSNYPYSH